MKRLFNPKKRLLTIILCFIPIFLSGCWDRTEINDLAIVVGVGLDRTDNGKIELSAQIVNPKVVGGAGMNGGGGQGGEKPVIVKTATGKTIYDARSKLQERTSRRLFEGHNRVIIIGKALAEAGIRKHIDFFARFPVPRLRANVFFTDGKATDILKVIPSFEDGESAEVARELAKLKIGLNVTTKDLLQQLASTSGDTALPIITESKSKLGEGLRVNGTAVFKNNKLTGQIDDKVTRGLLWIIDQIQLSAVTIQPKDAEGYISFKLLRSSTELIPTIKNGKWKMTVQITTEDDVAENETKLDMMDPKTIEKLEKQMEKEIDKRIQLVLDEVQTGMEADIFGFGETFERHYPKRWKQAKDKWNEKFPEIEVVIKSDAKIRRPGRSSGPQGVP
ncbi:Ger(x)C family spore germination protein [Lentibacillus cibarius]|uniref:Ger(X)C family spore germination protein n=1 Tax=Lentibacillus cibarius TaxID=2583219 RepID=A0A5S3QMQ1_9BACI|nr:Ger(x)C family spore germination protein [Lentibacillus cibarius]TMN23232.1 Ger(x)C family spore germination protein [Lentibacillus cibarius]